MRVARKCQKKQWEAVQSYRRVSLNMQIAIADLATSEPASNGARRQNTELGK